MVSDEELLGMMSGKKVSVESTPAQEQPLANGVVKRTFFQKTVFLLYPNGNVSLLKGECSSWFADGKEMWKKKPRPKAAEREEAKITSEEEY